MILLVLLSLSMAFASDNVTDMVSIDENAIDDESIALDDNDLIQNEEDSSVLSTQEVVTKDNFTQFFNNDGYLLNNVTADEIEFSGEISDVGVDKIVLNRSVNITGENAIFKDISISVVSDNVNICGITINQNKLDSAISISNAQYVKVDGVSINYNALEGFDGYAIIANNVANLKLINNAITYVGATNGSEINNVIRVFSSNKTSIINNKINAKLVSAAVDWKEIPSGSGNWVSTTISEGIVIGESNGVLFDKNNITVTFNNVTGYYDSIYSLDFKNSHDAIITDNNITSSGNTYIYGIILTGNNFLIKANNISSTGNFYANGIDIEGPASGNVVNNTIIVNAPNSVYGIYSGMNGQNVNANYTGNKISGKAYNNFAMSIGDVKSNIVNNTILSEGNYTTGIAYRGSNVSMEKNQIVLISSEKGNETIQERFGVEAVGVKVIKGEAVIKNNTIATSGKGVSLTTNATSATLYGNFINVVGNTNKDAYAIYAQDISKLNISSNTIDYQGTTNGTGINNGIYIENVNKPVISGNKFDLDLVSSYVPWFEVPTGSGNWISFPVSEGIVISQSNGADFNNNVVKTQYTDVIGDYDTIYAVSVKNSDNVLIKGNVIDANGHTYIYGLQVSGKDFTIDNNNITVKSDNYYADGIDIEGPANGVVKDNNISLKAPISAYGIYSGMNGQNVSATYSGNDIVANAYNAFGFSLGDVESSVKGCGIVLTGNYTTGIAYRGPNLVINNNTVSANGSNIGNLSVWEAFGVQNVGVKITQGMANIVNNTIETTGDYAVDIGKSNTTIGDNNLKSAKGTGNSTIFKTLKTSFDAPDTIITLSTAKAGYNYEIVLKDANELVLANTSITINNATYTTDANGVVNYKITASKIGTQTLSLSYAGDNDGKYLPTTANATIKIIKSVTKISAKKKAKFKAKAKTKKLAVTLKDITGKAISGVKVSIKIKKKTFSAKTNAKGKATIKIKYKKKVTAKTKVVFAGNDLYEASSQAVKITIKK